MNLQNVPAFLDRGEVLIWSARPAPLGYALRKIGYQWFFGLFFFGFSLFWIYMAGTAGQKAGSSPAGFFWMFGIPFVLIGASIVLSPFWYYFKAGQTQFALTDRRAVIDTQGLLGNRISISLREVPFVELQLGAGGSGNVLFTYDTAKYRNAPRRDGFIAIANAADVERKLRDAIETAAREPARAQ